MRLLIDEVIAEKGLLKKHVAKELGIDPNTLSRYISGKRKISLEMAVELSIILGCEITDLYERAD